MSEQSTERDAALLGALENISHRLNSPLPVSRDFLLNVDTLRHVAMEPIYSELREYGTEHFLGMDETMQRLATQDTGIARYGDGEFKVMLSNYGNHKFQDIVPEVQTELKEVISSSQRDDFLVAMPLLVNDSFWANIWVQYYPELKKYFTPERIFANGHVTRPIYFRRFGKSAVDSWRKVWDGMNVCIVTGKESKFDVIPELFDTLNGTSYVYGPNRNAYFDIDALEKKALEAPSDAVLISLGPAGTILAHRLAKKGKLALDIGHISASYKNVFKGESRPETA